MTTSESKPLKRRVINGRRGGYVRRLNMTPEARSAVARLAANARWGAMTPEQRSEAMRQEHQRRRKEAQNASSTVK